MSWPLPPDAPLSPNFESCSVILASRALLNVVPVTVAKGRCQWPGALKSLLPWDCMVGMGSCALSEKSLD